jgi:signal transduction histidine kinase
MQICVSWSIRPSTSTVLDPLLKAAFMTDNRLLNLAIENLVRNSLNAEAGVITVEIKPDLRTNCVTVAVDDTGPGIA